MKPKEAREFRKDRATELRRLAEILHTRRLVRDSKPLQDAANACGEPQDGLAWSYAFAGLEFDLTNNALRHTRPIGAELDSVELSVSLSGPCLDEGVEDGPFTALNVNIIVRGLNTETNELVAAWHLEKHKKDENSDFHHPDYHLHCGGKNVQDCEISIKSFSYGSLLLLESRRLEHKPLDGILAVDFVLGNFLGPAWQKLKVEDEGERYKELIKAAERRCHLSSTAAVLARLKG